MDEDREGEGRGNWGLVLRRRPRSSVGSTRLVGIPFESDVGPHEQIDRVEGAVNGVSFSIVFHLQLPFFLRVFHSI